VRRKREPKKADDRHAKEEARLVCTNTHRHLFSRQPILKHVRYCLPWHSHERCAGSCNWSRRCEYRPNTATAPADAAATIAAANAELERNAACCCASAAFSRQVPRKRCVAVFVAEGGNKTRSIEVPSRGDCSHGGKCRVAAPAQRGAKRQRRQVVNGYHDHLLSLGDFGKEKQRKGKMV
jgi:hypothetical protein